VYVQLVEKLDPKAVQDLLMPFTLRYIRILLRGNRIKQLTSERSLLKNLGMWLGRLSLARNKPIRFDQLDIKALLIEAFEQARFHHHAAYSCCPSIAHGCQARITLADELGPHKHHRTGVGVV